MYCPQTPYRELVKDAVDHCTDEDLLDLVYKLLINSHQETPTFDRRVKHGDSHTRLYYVWGTMKTRCYNPNTKDYKYYGGRGIAVCEEWRTNFSAFKEWALANGYAPELTIDRVDVDGDYCPENCRWVTRAEQNRNQRKHKKGTPRCSTSSSSASAARPSWSTRTAGPTASSR